MLSKFYVDDIIKNGLLEDINYIDIATDNLIDINHISKAKFISKDSGVVSGIDIAVRVFELIDDKIKCKILIQNGQKVKNGDIIATFEGSTVGLLKAERTALNILQHMSGIATFTNQCVEQVKGINVMVVDTRKTLPILKPLQKKAVLDGGGKNHRFNLSDAAMLKDNHIDAYGGIVNAVTELKKKIGHMNKIEVETRNLQEVQQALSVNVDVIMLDNMDIETMEKAVELINKKAIVEASGNITLENIRKVAQTGVDVISLGVLTHTVKAFDISMKIEK